MAKKRSPPDPKIAKHLKALAMAAQSGQVKLFEAALTQVRTDDNLSPLQRGAIVKVVAQEQAGRYFQIITGRTFGQVLEQADNEKK